jgi:hypothetical protein
MLEDKEITYKDLRTAGQRFINAAKAADECEIHDANEDAIFDEAATSAEELVEMLLKFYRNQKMVSLTLDAVAEAVREGY